MKLDDITECLFQAPNTIVDVIHPGTGRAMHSGETDDEVAARYPGAVRMDFDEAIRLKEETYRSPPTKISAEQFDEALNVLPPEGWARWEGSESFKMCERMSGTITGIYCRIGSDFFYMLDSFTMRHEEIVRRCREVQSNG